MKSNLVIFIPRSGSMLLSDLLAHHTNTTYLSEAWKLTPNDINLSFLNFEAMSKQDTRLFAKYLSEHKARRERMKSATGWTAKLHIVPALSNGRDFVEYCVNDPNVDVWLTHRSNLHDQFLSLVNAGYRQEVIRDESGGFIFTNKTKVANFDMINWGRQDIMGTLQNFIYMLIMWRNMFDMYGDQINVVNYERHIKPLDLTSFSIDNISISNYFKRDRHFVPTPKNVSVFREQEVWNECVEILKYHNHLVEV